MNKIRKIIYLVATVIACSCSSDEIGMETGQGRIYGYVIDASTNEPVQGAAITLYPGGETVISGQDGIYEFTKLQEGGYILQVSRDEYYSNVSSITIAQSENVNLDMHIKKGTPCLDILMGELNFGDVSSSKVFVISNISDDDITWNLFSDYLNMLSIDKTTGTLAPGENVAVNVSLNRGINMDNSSFPIYVRSGNDELGVIATINRASLGLHNSLLLGDWDWVEGEAWSELDQCLILNQISRGQVVLRFRSDFIAEWFVHQLISGDDELFHYNYECDKYSYDPANNVISFSNDYGTRIYQILYLDEEQLEMETIELKDIKEKTRDRYVRR